MALVFLRVRPIRAVRTRATKDHGSRNRGLPSVWGELTPCHGVGLLGSTSPISRFSLCVDRLMAHSFLCQDIPATATARVSNFAWQAIES